MKILNVHHICIQTHSYQESLDFYTEGLGFSMVKETADFHDRAFNTWLSCAGMMIELQTAKQGEELLPWSKLNSGPVHFCVLVEDVEEAYKALKAKTHLNMTFKSKKGEELYQVENSKLFKIYAPEGTEIEVRDDPNL